MIERIYIKELTEKLKCSDIRSVKRWCKKNQVALLSDNGCNKKYVIKAEFEARYMSESIKYIQEKYGKDHLLNFLNSSMKFFVEYQQAKEEKKKKHVLQSEHEIQFLTMLQNL